MMPQKRLHSLLGFLACGVFPALSGCAAIIPPVEPSKAFADAKATLMRSVEDADPFARSHAIEALGETLGSQAGEVFLRGLSDPSPAVRFAAAMAIGDTKYAPARDRLLKMAQDKEAEPDRRVVPAVIFALFRLGDMTYAGDLYTLLFDPEKEVRGNAALAMGRMEEPSAVGPLKTRLSDETDADVRLQVIESLAVLGDQVSALTLEASTKKTPFLEERLMAIPAMARVKSSTAPQVLNDLLDSRQPPRVRVAAAGALGMLGQFSPGGHRYCLDAARNPEGLLQAAYGQNQAVNKIEASSFQRLAAISLGWMNKEEAVPVLFHLLGSNDSGVRIAAAMSILRLLTGYQEPASPAAVNKLPTTAPAAPETAAGTGQKALPVAPPAQEVAPAAQPPALVAATQPAVQPAPPSQAPTTRPVAKAPMRKMKLKTAGGKDR